jgi:1,2-dihydroxy-3-keto-5-methylthiopentene dioxygenase
MAIIRIPATDLTITALEEAGRFLAARGILLEQWQAAAVLRPHASPDEVLGAYRHRLEPFMQSKGYRTADVVVLYPDMPRKDEIRAKFLAEHTHSEDEVRFFVDGGGLFWFHQPHQDRDEIFSVLCQRGDLIGVPAGVKHWFDCGERPSTQAIRIFQDQAGWVPHYTGSGIEKHYSV